MIAPQTVTLVGALSATTNLVTWLFEQNKDTRSIINLLEICAVDTESSGKDPHQAELFGVAFSVKSGEAFYLPVVAEDLAMENGVGSHLGHSVWGGRS
jgi:DNA polymerase I-like protein with 3'-5' exonuclease and polymerase domains